MTKKICKKPAFACASGIAALALICASAYNLMPSDISAYASAEETSEVLKVFVGDVERAPEDYVQQRTAYVEDIAVKDADKVTEAVIGLDDYYTVDEVTALVKDCNIAMDRVYMWPKGETGRLSLRVENNDIEKSMERYKQQVEESGSCADPQFAKDYQRFLDGEYEVFAITVTASAEALESLNAEADCINYVDVMHNDEAEKYAKKAKKAVTYIELPSKPDGAL